MHSPSQHVADGQRNINPSSRYVPSACWSPSSETFHLERGSTLTNAVDFCAVQSFAHDAPSLSIPSFVTERGDLTTLAVPHFHIDPRAIVSFRISVQLTPQAYAHLATAVDACKAASVPIDDATHSLPRRQAIAVGVGCGGAVLCPDQIVAYDASPEELHRSSTPPSGPKCLVPTDAEAMWTLADLAASIDCPCEPTAGGSASHSPRTQAMCICRLLEEITTANATESLVSGDSISTTSRDAALEAWRIAFAIDTPSTAPQDATSIVFALRRAATLYWVTATKTGVSIGECDCALYWKRVNETVDSWPQLSPVDAASVAARTRRESRASLAPVQVGPCRTLVGPTHQGCDEHASMSHSLASQAACDDVHERTRNSTVYYAREDMKHRARVLDCVRDIARTARFAHQRANLPVSGQKSSPLPAYDNINDSARESRENNLRTSPHNADITKSGTAPYASICGMCAPSTPGIANAEETNAIDGVVPRARSQPSALSAAHCLLVACCPMPTAFVSQSQLLTPRGLYFSQSLGPADAPKKQRRHRTATADLRRTVFASSPFLDRTPCYGCTRSCGGCCNPQGEKDNWQDFVERAGWAAERSSDKKKRKAKLLSSAHATEPVDTRVCVHSLPCRVAADMDNRKVITSIIPKTHAIHSTAARVIDTVPQEAAPVSHPHVALAETISTTSKVTIVCNKPTASAKRKRRSDILTTPSAPGEPEWKWHLNLPSDRSHRTRARPASGALLSKPIEGLSKRRDRDASAKADLAIVSPTATPPPSSPLVDSGGCAIVSCIECASAGCVHGRCHSCCCRYTAGNTNHKRRCWTHAGAPSSPDPCADDHLDLEPVWLDDMTQEIDL